MTTRELRPTDSLVRDELPALTRTGFDTAGLHTATRTRFDPNGFDRDGTDEDGFGSAGFYQRDDEASSGPFMGEHCDTGTALDLDGTDHDGVHHLVDSDGNCDSC